MKVLHLFNEIKFSGAEVMYRNAANLFQVSGVELIVWATGASLGEFSSAFEREGVLVLHKPLPKRSEFLRSCQYYKNLYRYMKCMGIDVLHIHRQDLFFAGVIAKFAGATCVKTQHSTFSNRWFTWSFAVLRRLLVRKLFGVVFHSIGPSVYKNELEYYKNKSVQINNWYDEKRFFPAQSTEKKQDLRDKLGIPKDSFAVISVGGCFPIKNHTDILQAVSLLKDSFKVMYLHLGTGDQETEEKELATKLGIKEQVRFVGPTDQVREFLVASDIFAMPSKFEGLGIAALEAMACGVTPVLYNVPGLRDLVVNEQNGYLVDPNWKSLASVITCSYNDKVKTRRLGREAAEYVKSEFSMSKNVQKMIELYKAGANQEHNNK